jgi:ABC-type molybdate transport system permease subunit
MSDVELQALWLSLKVATAAALLSLPVVLALALARGRVPARE